MSNRIKILSILTALFFITGCNSRSENVSAKILNVLTAQTAIVTAQAGLPIVQAANTLDASVTPNEKGALQINAVLPVVSGGTVGYSPLTQTFQYGDTLASGNGFVSLSKTLSNTVTDGTTTIDYQADTKIVLGGAKNQLKYGDFGYWSETLTMNVTGDTVESPANYAKTEKYWTNFLVYDPADASTGIPTGLLSTPNVNLNFTANVIGEVDLYQDTTYVETRSMTGSVSLNANFYTGVISGTTVNTFLNGSQWYTLNVNITDGYTTGGSFATTNVTVGGTNGTGDLRYNAPALYNGQFTGQFLGADAQNIPQEFIGQFWVNFTGSNSIGPGYRQEMHGVYGGRR